jgi:hypothetical protein
MTGLIERLRQMLCRHDWKRSHFVNIQTGENLGCLCIKCGKWKR